VQLESDRIIQDAASMFLLENPHSINSKELEKFEKDLAEKLQWSKLKVKPSRTQLRVSMPSYKTPLLN
jgi:hypothetical protein